MKTLKEVQDFFKKNKPTLLKKYNWLSELGIFGSYVRGEQNEESDVDVLVDYTDTQATMSFNATTRVGQHDRTVLVGSEATIESSGPGLQEQTVRIHTADGVIIPKLEGAWFPDGFHGAMAELLCAIEDNRTPYHHAAGNLESLALAFAAIGSAHTGQPKRPGEVRILPEK